MKKELDKILFVICLPIFAMIMLVVTFTFSLSAWLREFYEFMAEMIADELNK